MQNARNAILLWRNISAPGRSNDGTTAVRLKRVKQRQETHLTCQHTVLLELRLGNSSDPAVVTLKVLKTQEFDHIKGVF